MSCGVCDSNKAREVLAGILGLEAREVQPLCLPYESRDAISALHVVRRAIGAGLHGEFIAFIIPGLRCRLVVCSGERVDARIVRRRVSDRLSGLYHDAPIILISIDDKCVVEAKWQRTRARLDAESLEKCSGFCRELVF